MWKYKIEIMDNNADKPEIFDFEPIVKASREEKTFIWLILARLHNFVSNLNEWQLVLYLLIISTILLTSLLTNFYLSGQVNAFANQSEKLQATILALQNPVAQSTPTVQEYLVEVNHYQASNICFAKDTTLDILANGEIRVGNWVGVVPPEGKDDFSFLGLKIPLDPIYNIDPQLPHGVLMIRLSGTSKWFGYNQTRKFIANEDGCLEFDINDADTSNNTGVFSVRVHVL